MFGGITWKEALCTIDDLQGSISWLGPMLLNTLEFWKRERFPTQKLTRLDSLAKLIYLPQVKLHTAWGNFTKDQNIW